MVASIFVHPTADISPQATIGAGAKIWHQCQIREDAVIGSDTILGKGVYVDAGVHIGDHVKVQNGVSIYQGVTLEDGVFCGPHCVFTNDKHPRAINPDGTPKSNADWTLSQTRVRMGATIGAHATIVCGITIGRWAMVGAGAVVTRDVPDYGLVMGNPARLHGFVCPCGEPLRGPLNDARNDARNLEQSVRLRCAQCHAEITIAAAVYQSRLKTL